MNVSLLNLIISSALHGPYLSVGASARGYGLMVKDGHFARFFNSFLYASSGLHLHLEASTFSHFQGSAIVLERDPYYVDCKAADGQQQNVFGYDWYPVVYDCTYQDCHGAGQGGAMIVGANWGAEVKRCSFFNCSATEKGGALFVRGGSGDWISKAGDDKLESNPLIVESCCFVKCWVESETPSVQGQAVCSLAHFTKVFQDSFFDCGAGEEGEGYVWYMGANRIRSSNVNVSNTVDTPNIGAFNIMYIQTILDIQYHCVYGLNSKNVYSLTMDSKAGNDARQFHFIDVIDQKLSSGGAVFMVYSESSEQIDVSLANVNVFGISGEDIKFDNRQRDSVTVSVQDCWSDHQWGREDITFTETQKTNTFEVDGDQYCIFPPRETEIVSSEEELMDSPSSEYSDIDDMTSFEPSSELDTDEIDTSDATPGASEEEKDTSEEDPANTDDDSNIKPDDKKLDDGAIAGIVIGVLVVVAVIVILIVFLVLRRRAGSDSFATSDPTVQHEMDSETSQTITATEDLVVPSMAVPPTTGLFGTEMSDPFDRSIEEDA